jgi:hypothetical protein
MALTKSSYVPGSKLTFQDSIISPATLAAGTLVLRFDTAAFPQKAVKFAGTRGVILAAPVLSLGTAGTGGTFAAATYFWKLTAVDVNGGEAFSNEVTGAVLLNGTRPLTWVAVPNAVSYKLYRGTVTNTENVLVAATTALTYTDTGTAGSAGTVPATNTSGRQVPRAPKTSHGSGS